MSDEKESPAPEKIGFGALVLTVLAAAVGVQNKKNLEKDFTQSSPLPYIVAGVVFTALFLATLIVIVAIII